MNERVHTEVRLDALDLESALLRGIEDEGFEFCTPIQAAALPIALEARDVQGQAQTGTGKTAAFLLATMNHLLRRPPGEERRDGDPRALVLAPTRELAVQIHRDAEALGRHSGLRMTVVFGGTGYEQQRNALREGTDLLIGTPGRLIDYFKQRVYDLRSIEVAVIDEADRMFDLGFIRDVRYLLRRMPPAERRLNMLFSATLSHRVSELAYEHMNAPVPVNANPERVTVSQVSQKLFHVSRDEKIPLLFGLLKDREVTRTLVFTNTKRSAERLEGYLAANGLPAGMLTGDVPQKRRLSLLDDFTRGALPILVATDVASRGLHIPNVSHVFNFDLPQDPEDYVHRVGRTARVGAGGDAVSFACEEFVYSLMAIEEYIGEKIPTVAVSDELLASPALPPRGGARRRVNRPRSPRGRPRGRARASNRG